VEGVSLAAVRPAVNAYIADAVPPEHRSEAYGALSAAFNAGLFVGPLIGGIVGERFGYAVAFAVNVAVEVLAVALVWGRIAEPQSHEERRADDAPVSWRRLVSIPLAGAYAATFCMQIVMGMFSSLWTIWIHDLGGSLTFIGATFTVFALPQILLGALAGRLGDRWGRAPLLLLTGLCVSAVYVSYGVVTSLSLIMVLGVVEGVFFVFQQPLVQGLLADASPVEARGRVQGVAGAAGALGGASAAFASLPLYHEARFLPFLLAGVIMAFGAAVAALSAALYTRRERPLGEGMARGVAAR